MQLPHHLLLYFPKYLTKILTRSVSPLWTTAYGDMPTLVVIFPTTQFFITSSFYVIVCLIVKQLSSIQVKIAASAILFSAGLANSLVKNVTK